VKRPTRSFSVPAARTTPPERPGRRRLPAGRSPGSAARLTPLTAHPRPSIPGGIQGPTIPQELFREAPERTLAGRSGVFAAAVEYEGLRMEANERYKASTEHLGVSERRIKTLREGGLPARKVGRDLYFNIGKLRRSSITRGAHEAPFV
jgi:hypothetical protein